jgi:transcriptional regulator with XRE-family HTH domain
MEFDFIKTPKEIATGIAANLRARRKEMKMSMDKLAAISGVSYGSIKRFESSGEISLTSLLKIAVVLDLADEFENLLARQTINSIQEIIDGKV